MIMTPGGGGYGHPSNEITASASTTTSVNTVVPVRQSGSLQQYVLNQESV